MRKSFKAAVTFMVFASGGFAEATQVIVRMRSPGSFQSLSQQFRSALQSAFSRRDAFGNFEKPELPRFPSSGAPVVNALSHLNMVVVELNSDADLQALRANPEVSLAEAESIFPAPRLPLGAGDGAGAMPQEPAADEIPWGIRAVRAPEAWKLGAQGAGAKVAILDTGIDRDHPDLKNRLLLGKNFYPSRTALPSLRAARNLLLSTLESDPTASETDESSPYEYFDQIGHGTHVAGTIAGELDGQGVAGVAPSAQILAGRVCSRFGCSTVAIVNGINWAIAQGADVISMSLGGPNDSRAQREALEAADRAGVVAVAATGNDGTQEISFPAAYDSVIAVGAVDAKLQRAKFSQYGPALDVVAPGVDVVSCVPLGTGRSSRVTVVESGAELKSTSFVGAPEITAGLSGELAAGGLGNPEQLALVRGKVALIQRGELSFADKVKNALAAGAAAVVIYNNEQGLMSGALTQDGSTVGIPVVMIEQSAGEALTRALSAGQRPTLRLQTLRTNYSSFQGTSMATPHVSGIAALMRAANKRLTTAQVRDLMARTAQRLAGTADNELGAGLVNAEAAVRAAQLAH